jgi:hypothetical protein
VLIAFNVSITDNSKLRLFQKHWSSQIDKKMGLQKPILYYLREHWRKFMGKLWTELYE